MTENEQLSGTVRKIVEEKGFGFIEVEGFSSNVFFHAKDMRRSKFETLRVGDKVSIGSVVEKMHIDPKTGDSRMGLIARDVYLVS